ncbi:hypothetical protein BR93DRAFT_964556 [Coniochaeta sp. PMI_546]|nr:hypothetical protein BR93DRAFT_964556 [Coniochaeta sp. PMI_546]
MATHMEDARNHSVQQRRADVENQKAAETRVEEDCGRDDEEVRLRWPWLKQQRASVVAAFCFVTVLALTVLLPLLLVPSASSDEAAPQNIVYQPVCLWLML